PPLAGVDDRRSHPVAGLGHGGVGQPGHDDIGQAGSEVGLDDDHLPDHSDERDRPYLRVPHQNAPRRCSTRAAPARWGSTLTTSKRTSAGRTPDAASQVAASLRSRRAFAATTASTGSPNLVLRLVLTSQHTTTLAPSRRITSTS